MMNGKQTNGKAADYDDDTPFFFLPAEQREQAVRLINARVGKSDLVYLNYYERKAKFSKLDDADLADLKAISDRAYQGHALLWLSLGDAERFALENRLLGDRDYVAALQQRRQRRIANG
jgi:hypothetical protein